MVFRERPAVEHQDVLSIIELRLEFSGADGGRAVLVLYHLSKSLARNVDAAEELEARIAPGQRAAFQHVDVGVAEFGKPRGRTLRQSLTAVADHRAHRATGRHCRNLELEPAQRQAAGVKYMCAAESQFLAHVEQRKLLAVHQPRPQRRRIDTLVSH